MPNQNDSPPVLSGTVPAQPDYTLCKNIADLKITNNSGYEGLYVNFNTDDAVQTVFVIEADRIGFDPVLQQVSWNNVVVGTASRSSVFQQPTYSELFNVDVSQDPVYNDQILLNTSNITGWGHSVAMSKNSIGHNGALRFQASPLIQATRVLGLSTVMTKDFKQLDYAIVVGEWGRFAVAEKGKEMFEVTVSNWTDILTIERHNSDTINYCLNGKVFYTSATKSTAELYFIAIFYDALAQANHILMNYGICSDLTIKFNKDATEVAVEAVVKAVSYQGTAKTVGLSVTNNTGLKSAKTLAIKAPSTLSIPVLSGTIPRVHDMTLFEKCADLSISHEGIYSGLQVRFNTPYPQFTSFVVREINNVSFKADTRKISYNGVIIGTGNTAADMVKKGLIITFNDDAIKASVEEVTRAIGVNFQANAQDVTLSLVSYNGDKSVKTLTISAPFG